MFQNKAAVRQLARVALCEIVCVILMLAIYLWIGKFSVPVFSGAVFGCVMAIGYFVSLSITISKVVDQVQATGETGKARMSVQASSVLRLLCVGLIYVVVLKAGVCAPLAAVLPLIFLQVSINVTEYFRKSGE